MSRGLRIIITVVVGLIIIAFGTAIWLKNPDSHLIPIIFTAVGLALTFVFGLLSLQSSGPTASRVLHLPRLVVRADRDIQGQAFLLDSETYAEVLAKERNPFTLMQYIGEQSVDGRPIYGAVFRDLVPEQQYTFWTSGTRPIRIALSPGESRNIELKRK